MNNNNETIANPPASITIMNTTTTESRKYYSYDYSAAYNATRQCAADILARSVYSIEEADFAQLRQLINAMEIMRDYYTQTALQESAERAAARQKAAEANDQPPF